ncbi:hypothetical protein L211DRAFT_523334 [Terfezia boudieri ATCC MYA-4762]|uniref:Uncharacterized protein n=1 Tax=Terfezia boudieri ATCC MYA-4762 TaxID=1051890 RepID=A0A3N4LCH7_9PEZI|nr:hypothetical protein L211DRAFT_523334 [Terfezia boudieri ATCC MYA-4762]
MDCLLWRANGKRSLHWSPNVRYSNTDNARYKHIVRTEGNMLITNIFLYHKKLSKYGINSERFRISIMNITGAYRRQIKRYAEVQVKRRSQEFREDPKSQ